MLELASSRPRGRPDRHDKGGRTETWPRMAWCFAGVRLLEDIRASRQRIVTAQDRRRGGWSATSDGAQQQLVRRSR